MFSRPLFSINKEIEKRENKIKLYQNYIKKLHDLNINWSNIMSFDIQGFKSLECAGIILENINNSIRLKKNIQNENNIIKVLKDSKKSIIKATRIIPQLKGILPKAVKTDVTDNHIITDENIKSYNDFKQNHELVKYEKKYLLHIYYFFENIYKKYFFK